MYDRLQFSDYVVDCFVMLEIVLYDDTKQLGVGFVFEDCCVDFEADLVVVA